MDQIFVEVFHPELTKLILYQENHYNFPKSPQMNDSVIRGLGRGLVFLEGAEWHQRRKVLNKIFNFQLIKNMASMICEVADSSIKEMEEVSGVSEEGWVAYELFDLTADISSNFTVRSFLGGKSVTGVRIHGEKIWKFFAELLNDCFRQTREISVFLFGTKFP